ncbi:MAG: tetratricopeptide repeat protein, partial [Bacteroidia bacterium]
MANKTIGLLLILCLKLPAYCQENEQNLFRLALSQTLKEEYTQALSNFDAIIRQNPSNWDAYLYRSLCNLKIKSYKKTIQDCNVVIKSNPLSAKAYYYRGIAKSALNNHTAAIT